MFFSFHNSLYFDIRRKIDTIDTEEPTSSRLQDANTLESSNASSTPRQQQQQQLKDTPTDDIVKALGGSRVETESEFEYSDEDTNSDDDTMKTVGQPSSWEDCVMPMTMSNIRGREEENKYPPNQAPTEGAPSHNSEFPTGQTEDDTLIPFKSNDVSDSGSLGGLRVEWPDTATDFVKLFVTDGLIELVVEQTNLYAQQFLDSASDLGPFARAKQWKPVTRMVRRSQNLIYQFYPVTFHCNQQALNAHCLL